MFFALWDQDSDRWSKSTNGEYSFEIPALTDEKLWEIAGADSLYGSDLLDEIQVVTDQMESQYGVLDFEGGGDYFGYGSPEVEEKNFPAVLEAYRQFFISKGYAVGEPNISYPPHWHDR